MSQRYLPTHIDPLKLAEQGAMLEGDLVIAHMARLQERLNGEAGLAQVKLELAKDEVGCPFIHGQVVAKLPLLCQRCLQPVVIEIKSEFHLTPVLESADWDKLPTTYDPLLIQEDELVSVMCLVEDELILNLPLVARHEAKDCSVKIVEGENTTPKDEQKGRAANPFSVLARLKTDKTK